MFALFLEFRARTRPKDLTVFFSSWKAEISHFILSRVDFKLEKGTFFC